MLWRGMKMAMSHVSDVVMGLVVVVTVVGLILVHRNIQCASIFLVGEMAGHASCVKHSGTKSEATLLAFSSTECTVLR